MSIGDSVGRYAGVCQTPILASYADSVQLDRDTEVVITDPPFTPSGTIWEDNDVTTRYELREIPGFDKEISDGEGQSKAELLNQIDYGNGSSTFKEKIRELCHEFEDIIDDSLSEQPAKVA